MAQRAVLPRIEPSTPGREPGRRDRDLSDHAADVGRADRPDGAARGRAGRSAGQHSRRCRLHASNVRYLDLAQTAHRPAAPGPGQLQCRCWKHYPSAATLRRREGLGCYQRMPAGHHWAARPRNYRLRQENCGVSSRPRALWAVIGCYRVRIAVLAVLAAVNAVLAVATMLWTMTH